MTLKGKTAFVTGAGRGLGKAIAFALAREGSDVAVSDIDVSGANATAKEITEMERKSVAIGMDVSDLTSVQKGFLEARKTLNSIDILINNAAITNNEATIINMPEENWNREIAVNLSGPFYCVKQVLPDMIANKWGRIINISSIMADLGGFGVCGYAASKAGLLGLTKSIALEHARHNITCNALVLGGIHTEAFMSMREDIRTRLERRIPIGRPGQPEDVSEMVSFISSDKAAYINGAEINVSGGIELLCI